MKAGIVIGIFTHTFTFGEDVLPWWAGPMTLVFILAISIIAALRLWKD